MATVNFINRKKSQSRAGLRAVLNYTMQDKKTEFDGNFLVSGLNCTPNSVYEEFINTKLLYAKDDGRMYYHFVQSFPKNEVISPITAHEIALKLAENYTGFEVLVATHTDREHIHSHFIINSVNLETGKKLHQSAKAIPELRQKSDKLCMQYGLSICKPNQDRTTVKSMTIGEYHLATKGKSWKLQLANIIDECMKYAHDKDSFIALMESENIKVKWTDSRKNITYELADGKKCRDNKLYENKYLKERMEKEFAIRKEIINGRTQKTQYATDETADADTDTGELRSRAIRATDDSDREFRVSKQCTVQHFADRTADTRQAEIYGANKETRLDTNGTADLEQDLTTGWETERAFFFSSENQIADSGMVTDVGTDNTDATAVMGTVVGTISAMEQLASDVPVAQKHYQIDKKSLKKLIEKKQAKGQKHTGEDLEEDFEMTMGGY